ncbi:hypothetical protein [Haladaptatus sp. NG-SE-30]
MTADCGAVLSSRSPGLSSARFSTSGVLLLVVFVGAITLLSGNWKLMGVGLVVCGLGAGLFVLAFPGTYLAYQLTNLVTGSWGTSILTRFYSTIGPFITAFSSIHGFVGYGLGGTNHHIQAIVPPDGVARLAKVSWENSVNLKTLIGRLTAETGIIGVSLFGITLTMAYFELARLNRSFTPTTWSVSARVILAGLVTTVFGHGIAMGSFAIPFLWFWLALVDVQHLQSPTYDGLADI